MTIQKNVESKFEPLSEKEKKALQKHSLLILQIELVPHNCWYSNARTLKSSQWDKIRKAVYQKSNFVCEICGGKGTQHPVECHEVWIYDDDSLIQKLDHFQAICPLCHEVKHIGLATLRGNGERAFNRFKEVNKLDDASAKDIHMAVNQQWQLRSEQEWELDLEHLREYGVDPAILSKD